MTTFVPLAFYSTKSGAEPVREWLLDLPINDRRSVGRDLQRVQYSWPIGMPLARSLGHGLWEVRTPLESRRISRVVFCFHDGCLVALHAFIKKTQKTPHDEIKLAIDRMKELNT